MQRRTRLSKRNAVWGLVLAIGCASQPSGAPFRALPGPGPGQSLLYIYWVDETRTYSQLHLKLDGTPLVDLRAGQSLGRRLAPGGHELRLMVKQARWIPSSWTRHALCLEPGETRYLRVSTRYGAAPAVPDGVEHASASSLPETRSRVEVFAKSQPAKLALEELAATRWIALPVELHPRLEDPPASPDDVSPAGERCGAL